jgi:hypothetical protein
MTDAATITALAFKCREAYDIGTLPESDYYKAAGGVEYRIWEEDHARVIAFSGTNEVADVMADLSGVGRKMLTEDTAHGGAFHRGFLKAFQRARPQIYAELSQRTAAHGLKPLHITGHSLGGAYAVQLSESAPFASQTDLVVTFGCPRLCDLVWALASVNTKKIIRVVLDGDGVPRLLLWRPWIRHLGHLWLIDGANQIKKDPPFWKRFYSFVMERPSGHISDHRIAAYCRALSTHTHTKETS